MKKLLAIILLICWLSTPILLYLQIFNSIPVSNPVIMPNFSLKVPTVTYTPITTLQTPVITQPIITPVPTIKPTETILVTSKPIITPVRTPTRTLAKTAPAKTAAPTLKVTNRSGSSKILFSVSSYDLSVESCGKARNEPYFGKTRSGYSLIGKTRQSAMTIAADLNILPMGTSVYIEFSKSASIYNGVYTVRDTGGAIKGYKLDLFMGDNAHQESDNFGVQKAYVTKVD